MKELKWTVKRDGKYFGALELYNLIINDYYIYDGKTESIGMYFNIKGMEGKIKEEFNKAVEIEKAERIAENIRLNKERNENRPTSWSDEPVIMDFVCLNIYLHKGKDIESQILFGFHDAITEESSSWDATISVDISEHMQELKDVLKETLLENFNQFFYQM